METRLKPIEKPGNPLMKIAYWITKRKYGKVITPLKTIYARLPFAFSLWSNKIQTLDNKLSLPKGLILLIRIHVAQLNTCSFCIDIGKAKAMQYFKETDKFFEVGNFENSSLFDEEERTALRFATEMTKSKDVSEATYKQAKKYFDEEQLIGIGWVVASEHVYNLMNHTFKAGSDGLCVNSN